MNIEIENLGKRFGNQWIFKNLDISLEHNKSYAVTGYNGSGKSTLLQIIAGIIPFTKGSIRYSINSQLINEEDIFKNQYFVSPYQELPEEFTLSEIIDYHLSFRSFKNNISKKEFIEIINLVSCKDKEIRFFSSGMKQRVKLGFALYTESSLLILDEPATNLDTQNIEWYRSEIIKRMDDTLILIGSNQSYEYDFCTDTIDLLQYK